MPKFNRDLPKGYKPAIGAEAFVALFVLIVIFGGLGYALGPAKLIKTMFGMAFDLLINTCFYIMGIAVLAGALSSIMAEFGILALFNRLLSPLMRPVYTLPGGAALGILTTFLSDNPAILTLCDDNRFKSMFKRRELPALCNLGTAFGMGLIVTAYVAGLGDSPDLHTGKAVAAGLMGAVIGSIISTRLMLRRCKKHFGEAGEEMLDDRVNTEIDVMKYRQIREGNWVRRMLDALLEGGQSGVAVGMAIIPGVLIICTFVLLLTNGPDDKFPGVAIIPWLGEKLNFIFQPLFGFSSPAGISVPLTALGSAGAAIGLIPELVNKGLAKGNDLAVFTAMCMCWSGYLSTHVAMMDALKSRQLTASAIISHTFGGLGAGIAANILYRLLSLVF